MTRAFSHNEDAELDYRLRQAGYRIWMTDKTFMVYYPRASVGSLFRQYLGYGGGRARNILKHRTLPKLRQMIPLLVFPVVAGASLAFLNLAALIPAGLWMPPASATASGWRSGSAIRTARWPGFRQWSCISPGRQASGCSFCALVEARGGGIMTADAARSARTRPRSTSACAPTAGASWKRRCDRSARSRCRPTRRCGSSSPTMTRCRARDALVDAVAAELPFELLYVHCPAANISIARNACLDNSSGDFLAFIDDDETASSELAGRTDEDR